MKNGASVVRHVAPAVVLRLPRLCRQVLRLCRVASYSELVDPLMGAVMADSVVLRDLLRDRHWQTYKTFCREYDKAARKIDTSYVGSYPSRAQLHRWQSGDLKKTPHPQHCEVLEGMFPGVRVADMFLPSERGGKDAGQDVPLDVAVEEALTGEGPAPTWSQRASVAREAVAPGLPLAVEGGSGEDRTASLSRSLQVLGRRMRLGDAEIAQLASLAGHLVDLEMECSIDIAPDGSSAVTYRFVLLNLTGAPVKRLLREQWFENTDGIRIEPRESSDRKVSIQRRHDIGNMVKFACALSPPIEPGEVGVVSYTSHGGSFLHDHYWQQWTPRHTRHFTLAIRHSGVETLRECTAVEDQPDGSQVSALDDLFCAEEDGAALITVTRDYLQPGQSVTVRWVVSRADS